MMYQAHGDIKHTGTALDLLRKEQTASGFNAEQELRYREAGTAGLYSVLRHQVLNSYFLIKIEGIVCFNVRPVSCCSA